MYFVGDIILILFGAGVYAKKYKALLEYLHMDFGYFTDNDSSKWGTMLYGKPVISPDELYMLSNIQIIISSTHEAAIRRQLAEMGLEDKIIGLDELYRLCEKRFSGNSDIRQAVQTKRTILMDMYEGIGWGGTELWAANLAHGFKNVGENVFLIGGTEQPPLEELYENLVIRITEKDTIMNMVDLMEKNLPCVFINNFAGCAFMAAVIVKRRYPEQMKIISVIHNDNKSLFDAHMMLSQYVDAVFCVSSLIRKHMVELYEYSAEKYFFMEQPIAIEADWKREKRKEQETLRIGYAARLVRQQKRADLLPELISHLEQESIDYFFQIAGEGECVEIIQAFIEKNNLQSKIWLLGRIPKFEMNEFWKRQDIFVNISEYEGTSLSMLEAMSYGCVPVVTDVSGAKEFITEGVNGYICRIGDLERISDCIKKLDRERDRMARYGEQCRSMIAKRCDGEKYIQYWLEEVLRFLDN